MTSRDIVLQVIAALDARQIPYMLVGSFSSNLYGIPRSTKDADLVLQLGDEPISQLMPLLGSEFHLDQQMSFETATFTSRFVIQHPRSAFTVELFLLSSDPHDQERFRRRRQMPFADSSAWLPSAEDVIITKLRWSRSGKRSKDVDDVMNVLAVQQGKLDLAYIRRWCDTHGTRELLEELLTKLPA